MYADWTDSKSFDLSRAAPLCGSVSRYADVSGSHFRDSAHVGQASYAWSVVSYGRLVMAHAPLADGRLAGPGRALPAVIQRQV